MNIFQDNLDNFFNFDDNLYKNNLIFEDHLDLFLTNSNDM